MPLRDLACAAAALVQMVAPPAHPQRVYRHHPAVQQSPTHAQSPPATQAEWTQHGKDTALRQTRTCLGGRWIDADNCIYVAHSACEAALGPSVGGFDQMEGMCFEAAAGAWTDLMEEQARALRAAISGSSEMADKATVLSWFDKSQREWTQWIDTDESMTGKSLEPGSLHISYPLRIRMEATAHRAIELESLASTLST